MPKVGWSTHPRFLDHFQSGHPERPERLAALNGLVREVGLDRRIELLEPAPVDDDLLRSVHAPAMVDRVRRTSAHGGQLDPDTYVATGSHEIARLAAGAATGCVDAVLEGRLTRAFAAVRPPGHHATPDRSMGFCLYNNVALGAMRALRAGAARVAIIDWDVHHGNGTQDIFYEDARVLVCNTHEYPLYPGTGAAGEVGSGEGLGFTFNAPVPAYTGDAGLRRIFDEVLIPVVRRFRPDLILVSAGFDAHVLDPLAALQATTSGFHALARQVVDAANELCGGRVVVTLEGGYDLDAVAHSGAATLAALLDLPPFEDPLAKPQSEEASVSELIASLRLLHRLGPDG